MTHLTPDELLDAMEGMLATDRQAHLAACDECRRQLNDLENALNDAKHASVPEPSPLFWNHFSTRVNEAIDAQPAGGLPQWLRWQMLLPLGAAAILVLALLLSMPQQEQPDTIEANVSAAAETLTAPDDNWVMVATLVGDLDLDAAAETGVIEPGVAERAVLTLTAEEQQELTRLLKAELTRAKS
ncbi:MAG TPA: hypothetical protein VNT81_06790 [Vicinamibacterales bacterium]|nr:hypothetical protein [Vicinamibacterales bacterium]